jgi:hypothetical protein
MKLNSNGGVRAAYILAFIVVAAIVVGALAYGIILRPS